MQFANKIPFYGQVIVCLDDPNVQQILARLKKPVITYGFTRQAKYRVDNLRFEKGYPVFEILNDGESLGEVLPQLIKSPYKTFFLKIPYFMRVRKRLDAEKIRKIG